MRPAIASDTNSPALTDLLSRSARGLHSTPPNLAHIPENRLDGYASDFDLNPDLLTPDDLSSNPVAAAVLVPIVARRQLTVILTQRTERLPSHAGQIAFPGGKIDRGDAGPLDAALREANEEIGLPPGLVEPLGYLDGYRTGTGYLIIPVVALVSPDVSLQLNLAEVAGAFEVPFAFLMDEANHMTHARQWRGRDRLFYAMPYREHYIWGATAGIIKNLHTRLYRA